MKSGNPPFTADSKIAKEILSKYNITLSDSFTFSEVNLVIGQNGAGKTRFLKAVREIYQTTEQTSIMYGYFPKLSPSKNDVVCCNELPICTLYESLQEDRIEFDDFLREIELHNESYIPQLLTYHSQLQKQTGEKALKTLQDTYFELSGKKLLINENNICIRDKGNTIHTLGDSLNLFSPGELMIFYMTIFISLQKNSKKERIIILDEPECHLHPKALLKFVNIIKDSGYFTAIWIASHNLFLIPELDFQNIIYIENSRIISRSSRIYYNILAGLLGKEIDKTTQFFASLSQWQYSEYIAECFTDPEIIDLINPEDEQVNLFIEFVKMQPYINVLDYGGGSARLGLSLQASNNPISNKINYEIYDPKPKYTGNDFIVYNSLDSITKKYDCIVMMNVLHEITPDDWVTIFKNINKLLNKNAYLLFVETSILTKGEMPNKTGFLVLDTEELNILFNSSTPLRRINIKNHQKSVCTPIPKELLKNVSTNSVNKAIKMLEDNTLTKLKKIRETNDSTNPRYYAFLSQQYINAKLYNDNVNGLKTKIVKDPQINQDTYSFLKTHLYRCKKNIIMHPKLANILKTYLNHLAINTRNKEIISMLILGLSYLNMDKTLTPDNLDYYRKIIFYLKKYETRRTISLFLFCLFVLGDDSCAKELLESQYHKFVKEIISTFY